MMFECKICLLGIVSLLEPERRYPRRNMVDRSHTDVSNVIEASLEQVFFNVTLPNTALNKFVPISSVFLSYKLYLFANMFSIESDKIKTEYLESNEMPADILTKALATTKHYKFMNLLGTTR